ncbi:hypothetical protein J6590_096616 [Homalodisca vitripennis]|nr:hypothetical protein J6590_096616 [Homalodisca vitripennis]
MLKKSKSGLRYERDRRSRALFVRKRALGTKLERELLLRGWVGGGVKGWMAQLALFCACLAAAGMLKKLGTVPLSIDKLSGVCARPAPVRTRRHDIYHCTSRTYCGEYRLYTCNRYSPAVLNPQILVTNTNTLIKFGISEDMSTSGTGKYLYK